MASGSANPQAAALIVRGMADSRTVAIDCMQIVIWDFNDDRCNMIWPKIFSRGGMRLQFAVSVGISVGAASMRRALGRQVLLKAPATGNRSKARRRQCKFRALGDARCLCAKRFGSRFFKQLATCIAEQLYPAFEHT